MAMRPRRRSFTGQLSAWDIKQPASASPIRRSSKPRGHFGSLAVGADGNVVIAAIGDGLCVVKPDSSVQYVGRPLHDNVASPATT
jgi:hypothetical protein